MVEPRFDVVVVGGGPAGSAAARSLALQGRIVALVERSNYEQALVGETLPPAIRALLTQLGVWSEFAKAGHLPSYSLRCAWESAAARDNDSLFNPYGSGWHVDRAQFDAMLASAAQDAGATVLRATRVVSLRHASEGDWCVETSGEGGRRMLQGRILVDATGRRALVGRKLVTQARVADRLVGAVALLPARDTGRSTLIEAVENGWWYSAPLPDSRMVVACMTDSDLWEGQGGWLERLRAAPLTSERCGEMAALPKLQIVSAASVLRQPLTGPDWVAIGDAAMAFDPLSGQGVFKALDSGLRSARAIERMLEGDSRGLAEYESQANEAFESYLHGRALFYGSVRRWPVSEFWLRRAGGAWLG